MSVRLLHALHAELRHEPTEKRVRAVVDDAAVVDSTRAVLVWEPRRIVPTFAVPVEDVRAELVPAAAPAPAEHPGQPFVYPDVPFGVHTTPGESLGLRTAAGTRDAIAFRPRDADLAGHVLLDFDGFDAWYEEDERLIGHPRDPFARIDVRRSSRHVRVELGGRLLAESSRPLLLFETGLPVRFYLPREDVRTELRPSDRETICAYKGRASYWAVEAGGGPRDDLVWSYEDPLPDAAAVRGLVAFFDERVDVIVDGQRRERPQTEWS